MRATDQAINFIGIAQAASDDSSRLYIMAQGYRIITGQSREPMMHMVAGMSKIALIATAATTMAVPGDLCLCVDQLYGESTHPSCSHSIRKDE